MEAGTAPPAKKSTAQLSGLIALAFLVVTIVFLANVGDWYTTFKAIHVVFAVLFVDPPNTVPQIRIGVADARTHITLWGFVEQVDFKFRKKNRDAAFTDSVKLLVSDIQTLIGQNVTPLGPNIP